MSVLGASASSAVQSGAEELERGLSSGVQEWETDESQWPLTQPVPKYEGKIQCAGEAEYTNDRPKVFGETLIPASLWMIMRNLGTDMMIRCN